MLSSSALPSPRLSSWVAGASQAPVATLLNRHYWYVLAQFVFNPVITYVHTIVFCKPGACRLHHYHCCTAALSHLCGVSLTRALCAQAPAGRSATKLAAWCRHGRARHHPSLGISQLTLARHLSARHAPFAAEPWLASPPRSASRAVPLNKTNTRHIFPSQRLSAPSRACSDPWWIRRPTVPK